MKEIDNNPIVGKEEKKNRAQLKEPICPLGLGTQILHSINS